MVSPEAFDVAVIQPEWFKQYEGFKESKYKERFCI